MHDQPTERTRGCADIAARRASYERIIDDQQGGLLRAARRMCGGNEDLAQDLVQDALIRGYEAYIEGRFMEGSNAGAWLMRILTNGFINAYRRREKWESDVDVHELLDAGARSLASTERAPDGSPQDSLMASVLDEALERALAALAPDLRLAVVLVDVEGMEYAEAAVAMRVPIGTVRSRLSRARLRLHSLLLEYARESRRV